MKPLQPEEQAPRDARTAEINRVFAAVERIGTNAALIVLAGCFAGYLFGVLEPYVALDRLPGLIGEGVEAYVRANDVPTGWDWLALLAYGDMLTLAALVLLVSVVGIAYLALIPILWRQKDRIYLLLVVLQLAVFALAASGWLDAGGH